MFDEKKYGALLATTIPAVIESPSEYERIEVIFDRLIRKERSPEEDKLFDLLANLMEDFERRTLEPIPNASPVEMLGYLMRENDLRQTDLVAVFGTQSIVSEVLNGKREITKNQAKQLAEKFRMKVEAFI